MRACMRTCAQAHDALPIPAHRSWHSSQSSSLPRRQLRQPSHPHQPMSDESRFRLIFPPIWLELIGGRASAGGMNCRHTAGRRAAFAMLWALLVAGVGLRLAVDRSWSALPVPHVRASRRHQLSPNEKYLAWLKQNSHSLACTCFLFSCSSSTILKRYTICSNSLDYVILVEISCRKFVDK